MLRVSYSNPMGYVKVTENFNGEMTNYNCDLCFANIKLFAEIEHTNEEHRLHMFFADNDHLRRIVRAEGKNACNFLKGRHYYFNSFYRVATPVTVEMLNRLGAEVSFYYKKPKSKNK